MSKTRVPLAEADLDQLRAFATSRGAEFSKHMGASQMIGAIRKSGWTHDYAEFDDGPPAAKKQAAPEKVMASTLDPSLFTRRDLGQADAPMVYAAKLPDAEVRRLKAEGAIFIDGLTDEEIREIKVRQAELKRLRDLRDNSYVRVEVHDTKEEGALKKIPLAVNGVAMAVERGVKSDLRWPYYLALQAEETIFEKDNNDRIIGYRTTPTYPHSVIDGPDLDKAEAA
ncbi:MAG: hypothetical protein FJX55_03580 [Alphaproteobacteria bacterium]|nr:hypothetical protein [Alphaproteobacteria bacterium]